MRRRGAAESTLTLADLTLDAEMCLALSWRPPLDPHERERTRWPTWSEYLATFLAVRDELHAMFPRRDNRASAIAFAPSVTSTVVRRSPQDVGSQNLGTLS